MLYNVAKITTPDGVYFTARQDNRTPKKVVHDGIAKVKYENRQGGIYESLYRHEVCLVDNLATGLTEAQAKELKHSHIIVSRYQGLNVLNHT